MAKLSLSFITNQDHLNLLRPYRERRAGIEEVRYEVDIEKLPRHILQLAAAYLDEDAWIALKRQTTSQEQSIQEKEVFCNWLSYYADILRFQDIDSFAQSPAQRRKWFSNHPNFISAIATGKLPLNPKRHVDDSWQLLQTKAEEGANKKNAPPPGFVAVLLLLGTEWKSGVKQVQRVVCGLPALMHIETGKLATSDDAFCLNSKHLSSEDRDARVPRIGNLQVAGVMPSDAVKVENEGYGGDTAATRSWTTHWDHLNILFKQFQDKSTAESFQTFSWSSSRGLNNLAFLGAVAYTAVPVANRRLIALTEDVQFSNAPPLLLKNFIDADARQQSAKPSISWNSPELANARCLHVGHMGGDYGLDESQRRALWQAVDANHGDIVGVSGPPGTGKTSMLQGDIGTLVVLAALNQTPTVIIAASQTNQATTNMINAFSTIAKPYEPGRAVSIEHRWIDGFPSYGWYFPSASKRGGKDSAYQELFRGTMYDPALLAGGRSLNEDESPRSVSIVTCSGLIYIDTSIGQNSP